MSVKKKSGYKLDQLWRLRTWQLVILLILSLLLSASFLRINNTGMVERRNAVFSADKQGDQQAILNNLFALQRYSASHMNATTGTMDLSDSYAREVERIDKAAAAADPVKKDVLQKADEVCRAQFPGYSQAYVQCNAAEQAKYQGESALPSASYPNPNLYRHSFASPLWSPDFAGFSVLLTLLIALMILYRMLSSLVVQLLLRRHFDSI